MDTLAYKVDINTMIDECIAMFKNVLIIKGISVKKRLAGPELYLIGSKFGLDQMLRNLISNSIDSMDGRDQKHLKITAAMNDDSSSVAISIEDTGCGFSEELTDKIFAPYFSAKKQGTGLGLAVVKDVVEHHRGEIHVESRVGKGTTITVNLPVEKS